MWGAPESRVLSRKQDRLARIDTDANRCFRNQSYLEPEGEWKEELSGVARLLVVGGLRSEARGFSLATVVGSWLYSIDTTDLSSGQTPLLHYTVTHIYRMTFFVPRVSTWHMETLKAHNVSTDLATSNPMFQGDSTHQVNSEGVIVNGRTHRITY